MTLKNYISHQELIIYTITHSHIKVFRRSLIKNEAEKGDVLQYNKVKKQGTYLYVHLSFLRAGDSAEDSCLLLTTKVLSGR